MALADFATGNAVLGGRSSVTGVQDEMARRIEAMTAAMPPEIRARFQIISGFRDAARQAEVNPGVKNSRHMHGMAVDLAKDPEVLNWINQHPEHGVGFPLRGMPGEENHLEMLDTAGARMALRGAPIGTGRTPVYAETGDPQFKSGLGKFGVAEANLPPAAPEPEEPDNRPLLAALALQQSPLNRFGPASLSDALTQRMQPAPPQPQPILPSQTSIIGGPLPLSRRLT